MSNRALDFVLALQSCFTSCTMNVSSQGLYLWKIQDQAGDGAIAVSEQLVKRLKFVPQCDISFEVGLGNDISLVSEAHT